MYKRQLLGTADDVAALWAHLNDTIDCIATDPPADDQPPPAPPTQTLTPNPLPTDAPTDAPPPTVEVPPTVNPYP